MVRRRAGKVSGNKGRGRKRAAAPDWQNTAAAAAAPAGDAAPAGRTGRGLDPTEIIPPGQYHAAAERAVDASAGNRPDEVSAGVEALAEDLAADLGGGGEGAPAGAAPAGAAPQVVAVDPAALVAPVVALVVQGSSALCVRVGVSELGEEEGAMLSGALHELARAYDVLAALQLDPRSAAWLGVGSAAFAIAFPRVFEYRARRAAAQQARDDANKPTV